MRKIITLFSLLMFLYVSHIEAQQAVIGTGNQVPTYTLYSPMYRFSNSSTNRHTACNNLYTAAEMSAAGIPSGSTITSIAYFKNGTGGTDPSSNLSMQVYMANSSTTPPLATTTTVADIQTSHSLVYTNASHVIATTSGWHEIVLATPFVYLGGSLEIAIFTQIDGTSPYSTDKFDWVYTSGYADYVIGQFGSTALAPTATLSATTADYKHRPNIQISYLVPNLTADAGVSSLVNPMLPAAPGNQNVDVTITTLASTSLTSVDINWAVNGTPQTAFAWTGNVAQFAHSAPITLGTYNFPFGNNTIKVWTSNPNGMADEYNDNDTLEITMFFADPLAGNYTINSTQPTAGTNFNNFTDFANVIGLVGVGGAVVVDVVAGTGPYNEQVIFNEFLGSSATNTLTINGNGETLEFLSTNTNERATLKFNGTDYVIVNNLVVKALGVQTTAPIEYGWAVWLTNNADFNTFNNCEFYANTTTTSLNYSCFVTSNSATSATTTGLAASNLTITNCTTIGGYYGIVVNGPSAAPYSDNNVITNNEILDFHLYGLYLRGQNNSMISDNIVRRPTRTTTGSIYGIYLAGDMTNTRVINNQIYDFSPSIASTSTAYGIYGTGVNATVGQELLIANNVIYGLQNINGTQYGIHLLTTDNTKIYHNSISLDNVSQTGSSIIRGIHHSGNLANIDIRNNIISITSNSTGIKYCLYFAQTLANIPNLTSDNNVLHMGATAGTNHIAFWNGGGGPSFTNLGDWQAAGGGLYDQSSVNEAPVFVAPSITPTNAVIDNMGQNLMSEVPGDLFGVARTATPDPGAIEFDPPSCPPVSSLTASGITNNSAMLGWTSDAAQTAWNVEVGLLGFAPGTGTEVVGVAGTTSNPWQATTLIGQTTYDFYVQGVCGVDEAPWTGPFTFTTACDAMTDFFEDFDSYPTGNIVPDCWDRLALGGSQTISSTSPASGTRNIYQYSSNSTNHSYVILPWLSNVSNGTHRFRAKFRVGSGTGQLEFGYLTDITDASTYTLIQIIPITNTTYGPETIINIPASVPSNARLCVRNAGATTGSYYWDDAAYEQIPTCPAPTALTVIGTTTTSAMLGWTEMGSATTWDIELGLTGFTPTGTPTQAGVTNNPYNYTSLLPSTTYQFYVRAFCGVGDESTWVGPFAFTTDCDAYLAPFLESFNSGVLPNCWTNTSSNPTGNGLWKFAGAPDYGAIPNGKTAGTYAWNDGSSPVVSDVTLITPLIDLAPLTHPMLSFEWFSNNTNTPGDNVPLIVEIFNGATWTTLGTFMGDNPSWQTESISLLAYAGTTVQIRFVSDQTVAGTAFYNDILLDEVSVDEAPACPAPIGLNASNVTATQADLSWIDNGTSISFNVEVGLQGFTPGTGTEFDATTTAATSWTVSGLTPVQTYHFYVQAFCGGTEYSSWTGPFEFTTTVSCPAPTALTVLSTTTTSAMLGWTEMGSATTWDIELGLTGFTPTGTPTQAGVVANPYNYTGLAPSTNYQFYVRAVCGVGDESTWVGPFDFQTACDVFNLPLIESFNTAAFPVCWSQTYEGALTSERWATSNTNLAGGTAHEMRAGWQNNLGISRLITPPINTVGLTQITLEFKMFYNDYGSGATLKIQSSNDGVNWTDENWSYATGGGSINATTISVDIVNNLGATTYLAWVIDGNHFQINNWNVDDVSIFVQTLSDEADITSFTIPYQYGSAVIDNTVDPGTVAVDVFTLAYMPNTAPTVGISAGASINPDPALGIQNIPVQTYTVTAEDGITQKVWNVTFTEVNHNLQTANNNGFSIDMSWDAFGCDNYVVHYRPFGTSTWIHKPTTTNALHVKPLLQNTQYEWRVLYYDGATHMGVSPIATFNTPNLIEVTKDMGTTILFEWNAIAGMTNYIVYYREQGPNPWRHGGSAGTQRQVWNLNEGATYEYRLLMFDGTTYMGATPIYTYTTTPVTFTVTNITANTAVINWANVVNVPTANAYVVHYRVAGSSDPWRHGGSTTNSRQVWDLAANTSYEYRLLVYDTDGYFGVSQLETFTTIGSKELAVDVNYTDGNIHVYPNPFNDMVYVEIELSDNSNMAWSIFDMSGKLVMSGTQSMSAGMNNFAIEATHLPSGLYMLKANIGGAMHTARILKQ
jgi:hypothetical protein